MSLAMTSRPAALNALTKAPSPAAGGPSYGAAVAARPTAYGCGASNMGTSPADATQRGTSLAAAGLVIVIGAQQPPQVTDAVPVSNNPAENDT